MNYQLSPETVLELQHRTEPLLSELPVATARKEHKGNDRKAVTLGQYMKTLNTGKLNAAPATHLQKVCQQARVEEIERDLIDQSWL